MKIHLPLFLRRLISLVPVMACFSSFALATVPNHDRFFLPDIIREESISNPLLVSTRADIIVIDQDMIRNDRYHAGVFNPQLIIDIVDGVSLVWENSSYLTDTSFGTGGAISIVTVALSHIKIGDDASFNNNSVITTGSGVSYGGAICAFSVDASNIILGNRSNFSGNFSTSEQAAYGGAVCGRAWYYGATIDVGSQASFSDNYAHGKVAYGGALAVTTGDLGGPYYAGKIRFAEQACFSGNNATGTEAYGGGVSTEGGSTLEFDSQAVFTNNFVVAEQEARGGAIYGGRSTLLMDFKGQASFSNNYAKGKNASGGAIFVDGGGTNSQLLLGDESCFSGNFVVADQEATGGAIRFEGTYFSVVAGKYVDFSNNYVRGEVAQGGAIYTSEGFTGMILGEGASFTDNYAYGTSAQGGAIYHDRTYNYPRPSLALIIGKGATFTNNYASSNGGAIFVNGYGDFNGIKNIQIISGPDANTVFKSNMTGGTPVFDGEGKLINVIDGVANAIHMSGDNYLELVAEEKSNITFYDPITSSDKMYADSIIDINKGTFIDQITQADWEKVTAGQVVFDGSLYAGDDAHLVSSRYYDLDANTTVHGGELVLKGQVVYGREGITDNSFTIKGGAMLNTVDLNNTVNAGNIILEDGASLGFNTAHVVADTAMLNMNGSVIMQGTGSIDLFGGVVSGRYWLASATAGSFGNSSDWTLKWRGEALGGTRVAGQTVLDLTDEQNIYLDVNSVVNYSTIWMGNRDNIWNLSTPNWIESKDNLFFDGDKVLFDDRAARKDVVIQSSNGYSVAEMIVNANETYTFSGYGMEARIIENWNGQGEYSSGKLIKDGAGTLDLTGIRGQNTFEGGVEFNDGTIKISNDRQLGSPMLRSDNSSASLQLSGYRGVFDTDMEGVFNLKITDSSFVEIEKVQASYTGRTSIEETSGLVLRHEKALTGEVDNSGMITFDAGQNRGSEFSFESLSGMGGHVRFANLGDTLNLGTLDGSQTFDMEVNVNSAESDRIVIAGVSSGTHTANFRHVGGSVDDSRQIVQDVVTFGGLADGADINTMFTGGADVGLVRWDLVSNEVGTGYDLVNRGGISNKGGIILNVIGSMSTRWFDQLDTLTKRMGELRMQAPYFKYVADHNGDVPSKGSFWVRTSGNRTNVDLGIAGATDFKEYQYGADVGADWVWGLGRNSILMGGLFVGYQRSELHFNDNMGSRGNADSYHEGLYATWLHNTGWYADVVAKGQNFETSYKARGMNGEDAGDYNTWGMGLSVEVGKQWTNKKGYFIEPSVQAAWLHVNGKELTMNDGTDVHSGSAEVWQFAANIRMGKTYSIGSTRLQPYAKLGIVEQAGNGGVVRANGAAWRPNTDGTRGMMGAGVIWQMSSRDQIHIDYEYLYGDKYDRPWTVNLGYSRSF